MYNKVRSVKETCASKILLKQGKDEMAKNLGKQMLEVSNQNNITMRNTSEKEIPIIEGEIKTIKEQIAQGDSSQGAVESLKEKEAQLRSMLAIAYERD